MRRADTISADELLELNIANARTELVRGHLVVREPAGPRHGEAAARVLVAIATFVYARQLGRVFAAETGFILRANPDTVRAPDVAFIRADRLIELPERGYAALAPDLVVEVLSPDDRQREVHEKVSDWLRAGSALVWVVDPVAKTAQVFRADGTRSDIGVDGALEGELILQGFSCALATIL